MKFLLFGKGGQVGCEYIPSPRRSDSELHSECIE